MAWVEQHGGGFRVRARTAGRVYTDSVHIERTGAAIRADELTGQERTRRDAMAAQVRHARATSARTRLGPDPTLGAWAAHWSTTLAVTDVTRANYECYPRVHIMPRFGHTPISLIGRSDIKAWAVGLRGRYMPSTVT